MINAPLRAEFPRRWVDLGTFLGPVDQLRLPGSGKHYDA